MAGAAGAVSHRGLEPGHHLWDGVDGRSEREALQIDLGWRQVIKRKEKSLFCGSLRCAFVNFERDDKNFDQILSACE